MKKRILLSLVSFFAMTAMWASLVDAYQIYVTAGAAGKAGETAELTLNMKNKNAIGIWQCTLVLPEGVTYQSIALAPARYPEAYAGEVTATPNEDGTVTFVCAGAAGVAMTGNDGAIATVTVAIDASVAAADYTVTVKDTKLSETNDAIHNDTKTREYVWTIEEGAQGTEGDLNGDGKVDIADAVQVLNIMASGEYNEAADLNKDEKVDIADFVMILNIMAGE